MAEIVVSLAAKKAEELVGKLVDKLYTTVSKELSLLLRVREEIKFIRGELEVMSAFLRGAEEIQDKDPTAMAWVKQVKELAYAAEDCIDEFSLHLARPHNTNFVTALWQRGGSLSSLGALHHIAAKIQSMKAEVEEVSNRRLRYNISHKPSSSSYDIVNQRYDPQTAALFLEDSQVVGIEKPREKLINWLDEDNSNLSLIAVVGAGGSGKTTLAKKVFDSSAISMRFTCRAWITVSQDYNTQLLLRSMIRQLLPSPPKNSDEMDWEELIKELKDYLKDKRYVIVFDDIWKVEAWLSLQDILPQNKHGSRIIITTRNFEVAKICVSSIHHGHVHEQEKLSEEQSMDLFRRRLPLDLHTCSDERKSLVEGFLKKCDGLPLAIVATSAALAGKTSQEWKSMLTHLSSELESNPNLQGVMQVLNLSYTDLPYHVKRCFLYLTKFPEDTEINCSRIRRLWVAEGLVSGRRGMTAEEAAESYLDVLVNRCMILPLAFNVKGRVKSFKIHDIMLEMIVSKSIEENFLTPLLQKDSIWTPQEMIRRLSINNKHIPEDLTGLRSLTMFGYCGPSVFLKYSPTLRLLRVLELEDCEAFENKHFKVICQYLFHLKYLSLRYTRVYRLPSSIRNLCNLETLYIRGRVISSSPKKIYRLERLRFLSIGYFHLDLGCSSLVPNLGRLRNLQELGHVKISDRRVMKELQKLNQLRKLKITLYVEKLGESGRSDFCGWLENLSSTLRSLVVVDSPDEKMSYLSELKSPPVKLESLTLDSHLGTLPDWTSRLGNLLKLTLRRSRIGDDGIQALGRLPNLIKLQLGDNSYIGERLSFGAQSGFPSLKELSFEQLVNLRSLIFEQGALQCVASVSVRMWGPPKFVEISGIEKRVASVSVRMPDRHRFVEISGIEKRVASVRMPDRHKFVEISGIEKLGNLKEFGLAGFNDATWKAVEQAIGNHPNHPTLRRLGWE